MVMHYYGNVCFMAIARSKITAQGQISVPAEVRKRLGVGPGSILEWDESNDQLLVRRAGRHTSTEIHNALFPHAKPTPKTPASIKEGIRKHVREKHARR
jgi:antitoxin PrlF